MSSYLAVALVQLPLFVLADADGRTNRQADPPIWDELCQMLQAADPYKRQMSIHNGNLLYNHSRPWISHVSLQGLEDRTADIRARYGKPVVWDEVQCEYGQCTGA